MKKRVLATLAAGALLVASFASAGAYWVADPGPDPDRCGMWYSQIQRGGAIGATAQRYFDRYNCEWVEPEPTAVSVTRSR